MTYQPRIGLARGRPAAVERFDVSALAGGLLAVFAGVLAYALALAEGTALAPLMTAAALVNFGALGLIGFGVSRSSLDIGALIEALAGLALAALGGGVGLIAGVLLAVGAAWALAEVAPRRAAARRARHPTE